MRQVTFKEFITAILGGLWQILLWVLGLFGYKDESTFGLALKRIFATCFVTLTVLVTFCAVYSFYEDFLYRKFIRPYTEERVYSEKHLGGHIVFQELYYSDANRICNALTKEILVEEVDWVVTSDKPDSLAVFAKKGRRGYINRFTGEVAVPLLYTRAWVFSEGLAAVERNGLLSFIDPSGNTVIETGQVIPSEGTNLAFHHGHCPLRKSLDGKVGLIDRVGNWAIEPIYDNILFDENGFWYVEQDDKVGLYTQDLQLLFPVDNTGIMIYNDAIEVRHADHVCRRYDLQGNLTVDFVIDEVNNLTYATTELRNDLEISSDTYCDTRVYAVANCQRYKVANGHCDQPDYFGLMNREGKIVTQPLYTHIEAIGKNLYLCMPDGIIINDQGKRVQ